MSRLSIEAGALVLLCAVVPAPGAEPAGRPNILWITSEDNGPHLGCYGDAYARTPHLDTLAASGMIYLNAWSNAPVCAPARTAIITGVMPTATGSEHMRSQVQMPAFMRMYPQLLREAGYYCTNNAKEDYNLEKPGRIWDASSRTAHWKNRGPGQPFFAVFNILNSHESRIRSRPHELKHDPAKVRLPAYHPDVPEVRLDWAQYYDKMTEMDAVAGEHLRELHGAGLAEDTIVFYYGDHGMGLPRNKRCPQNSGLWVPLIVHVPHKFRHLAPEDYRPGARSERLVSFIDLAPTVLSLAGVEPPRWMHGRAFLGPHAGPEPDWLHGFRGRMDERYDLIRSIRDRRYVYIRNYMPHLPAGQHMAYMFETPTTQVWKKLYDQGELRAPQTFFWEPKAPEELYDLHRDPDEVNNLADCSEHQEILRRMRSALREHVLGVRDLGFLPEGEIHSRSKDSSPYEVGQDKRRYPLERILGMADLASSLRDDALPELASALSGDADSAVRYWAAMGILMRGRPAVDARQGDLERALEEPSPYVRIVAAEALGRFGSESQRQQALSLLLDLADVQKHGLYVAVPALNAIDALGPPSAQAREALRALPETEPSVIDKMQNYIPRLLEAILREAV